MSRSYPTHLFGVARRRPRGFTLLEVLLAAVIFAILGIIVLATFRTGTRAYETAQRQTQLLDRAQFVFDSMTSDIHASFTMAETEYNRSMRNKIEELEMAISEAQNANNWDTFFQKYGNPDKPGSTTGGDGTAYAGNPFEQGILVDLAMVGEGGGEDTMLSFVRTTPTGEGGGETEWGLMRVRYEARGGLLVRSEESIIDPVRNVFGQYIEPPPPRRQTILAEGVKALDIKYGFWFDEVWIEQPEWQSNSHTARNSMNVETPDPDPARQERLNDPNSPEYAQRQLVEISTPPDGMPGYARITLELADPRSPQRSELFTTIIRFPTSQETFVPNTQLDTDRRDGEIRARIDKMKGLGGEGGG